MEAIGELTGGMAHDFNNLLTPIIGSLDMLQRRGVGTDREQRLIAGALAAAERAKVVVQRLLAFARRQPLQPSAVDVAALLRGMVSLVTSGSATPVEVVLDLAGETPAAHADPNQLEMAILNLAVNARDAMPEGGVLTLAARGATITEGHPTLARGDYVRISVADTGKGMDEATLARAVEPFFSTKGVGQGTGLGLSVSYGIIDSMGGTMGYRRAPAGGALFYFELPAYAAV
jgi:signal transduction histidine kinase